MSTDIKGPFAVLKLPRQNLALLLYGKKVLVAMTSNPHFPAPSPPLAVLEAAVAALDASETATGGGKASTAQRNIDRRALILCLEHERHHVQSVAEQQTSQADAEAVIISAGMFVRQITKPSKAPLAAKHGPLSGSVGLVALAAAPNAVYYWQWSTNQETWFDLPDTMTARTLVTGLVPGTIHFFRVHAITRAGLTAWSQVVSLMVN